jgi:hypothetical protein
MTLVERRIAPRYEVKLQAWIATKSNNRLAAWVTNISMSGIQILVDNAAIPTLMPPIERSNKLDTIPVMIHIALPSPFEAVDIELGIVYFNRVSQTQSAVGCRFEGFVNDSARRLSEYLLYIQNGGVRSSSNKQDIDAHLIAGIPPKE